MNLVKNCLHKPAIKKIIFWQRSLLPFSAVPFLCLYFFFLFSTPPTVLLDWTTLFIFECVFFFTIFVQISSIWIKKISFYLFSLFNSILSRAVIVRVWIIDVDVKFHRHDNHWTVILSPFKSIIEGWGMNEKMDHHERRGDLCYLYAKDYHSTSLTSSLTGQTFDPAVLL